MHILKNTRNGICLWVQIGVHVPVGQSARQLDQFVLLACEEDEVQDRQSDGEFSFKNTAEVF